MFWWGGLKLSVLLGYVSSAAALKESGACPGAAVASQQTASHTPLLLLSVAQSRRDALSTLCREISVQWLTRDAGTPTVKFGLSADSLTSSVTGYTSTYTRADMCGAAANSYGWIDAGTMNNVVVTNLTPSTTYYYAYGDPVSEL